MKGDAMEGKSKKIKLTSNNYIGLALFWGVLLIGILGGLAGQKWAENIYTFISFGFMIIFIFSAIAKTKFKPIHQLISTYFIHVLFCVAMGWWWLAVWWIITTISAGIGMHYWIEATKETIEK